MVEWIYMRKSCVEFLKNYSDELLSEIIPNVFEIGVLTLKNSFHKMIFSKDELRDIIYDLRKNYFDNNIYLKSINEIRKLQRSKHFKNINENINKDDIEKGIYSGKRMYRQKKEIYPNWWWDENAQKNSYINNNNDIFYYHNNPTMTNYLNNNSDTFNYDDENYHHKTRRKYSHGEKKSMKINLLSKGDFKDNTNINNKHNHKKKYNDTTNSKQNKNINMNYNNIQKNESGNQINKKKINYKISYDKDLKPEEIKRKGDIGYQYSYYKGNIERIPSEENIYHKNEIS